MSDNISYHLFDFCTTCGMILPKGFCDSEGFTQWIREHKSKDEAYFIKHKKYPIGGKFYLSAMEGKNEVCLTLGEKHHD